MLNQVNIIGNLGADPTTRTFQNGNKVCNLRVACSEHWKDKATGERKERTEWVSVAIFNDGLVRVAEQYLRKGSKVYVSGRLTTRKWQDQSGQDRYSTEVVLQGFDAKLVMLDGKPQGTADPHRAQEPEGYGAGGRPSSGGYDDLDSIPFLMEWRI